MPLRSAIGLAKGSTAEQRRPVQVSAVDIADVHESTFSVTLTAVGTVQPIASIALRSRIDAMIDRIDVPDGASVRAGDTIIELDARQIRAQVKQNEALLEKDVAARDQSLRDVARAERLLQANSGPQLNLDNAKTALDAANASINADRALIENLKVQESWYTIKAPISGRLGIFASKPGNIIRTGDNTTSGVLATINQLSPIYVIISMPQVYLQNLRESMRQGDVKVAVTPQGGSTTAIGKIVEIEPQIDASTGTVPVRALMDNADEMLWPGQLCNTTITLQTIAHAIAIPRAADQVTANGDFVYVVDGSVAHRRDIKVTRSQTDKVLVTAGLNVGEKIVTDGQLTLTDGAPVLIRTQPPEAKAEP